MPTLGKPVAVGLAAAGLLTWIAIVDPNQPGHYPTCPSLALLGIYCPGCGSLRGIHALTQLDFFAVLAMNPALLPAIGYLAWAWIAWLLRSIKKLPRRLLAPAWVGWTIFATMIIYWVLRNIPALAPWLAPGGLPAPAFS